MNEFIALFEKILQQLQENINDLSPDEVAAAQAFLQEAIGFIQEEADRTQPPGIPQGADLLWILSGGQQDAFVNYLRSFPSPELNSLLRNPTQLNQTIARLEREMPHGAPESADGIEHAPLQSSNIYGFRYDPKTGKLMVRFNSGSVYGYTGVSPAVFKIFQNGAVPAKTTGKNKWGQWWTGKIPSLGAAFHALIKLGGYPYQRLS